MARVNTFSGPPKSAKGKRKAAESSGVRRQEERGEASSTVPQPSSTVPPPASTVPPPASSGQRGDPPSASEPAATAVVVAPPSEGLVIIEEEEEEEDRPLKRRKAAQVADLSPRPRTLSKGKEKVAVRVAPLAKNKGKVVNADTWESAISLDKNATVSNIKVALHIAERAIPPKDEEFYDSASIEALTNNAVRNAMREVAFVSGMRRRIELLSREVNSLLEQAEKSKAESAEVREERDIARAQLTSLEERMAQLSPLEEEKKLWVDERNLMNARLASEEAERCTLRARLASEEVERVKAMAARRKLALEHTALQQELEAESRLKAKYLHDCRQATEDRAKAEDMLKRERASIKNQRIEAIKRWQRRSLQEECVEYACDLALMILQNCYNLCIPEGSDGPSFDEFAEPMLPSGLGLTLEEIRERIVEDKGPVPDEELDYSSAEEGGLPGDEDVPFGEDAPPTAPLNPIPLGPAPASDLPPAAEAPAADSSPGYSPSAEVSPGNLPTSPSGDF